MKRTTPPPPTITAPGGVVAGVDTHRDTHHAAVITTTGQRLSSKEFPATSTGYEQLLDFLTRHGALIRVGIEGTNSYGAGLARHLRRAGIEVREVLRPARQVRRRRGKTDAIDAYQAAAQTLADTDTVTAKSSDAAVEALRVIHAARHSAVKARTEAINQLHALLVTAPESLRADYRHHTTTTLINRLARSRPHPSDDFVTAHTRQSLRRLARRCVKLGEEERTHDRDLQQLVDQINPALRQALGIGTITAAQLLITAGDNPDRLHTEAAFAMLCGAAPIPASSGLTNRHRLNRGGDRQANSALHQIAVVRLGTDPTTRAYAQRRRAEGKTTKDILRCLKRAIAREIFHHLTNPTPPETTTDLQPTRQQLGLTQHQAATAYGTSTRKISELEHGTIRNTHQLHHYRHWLNTQQPTT